MSAIEVIGHWVGRRMAEVAMVLRDKPMVPCQVDWEYRENFVDPLAPTAPRRYAGTGSAGVYPIWGDQPRPRATAPLPVDDEEDCYCTDTLKEMRHEE